MEELQLSLTPARVDQKNFGIWLKSWQVGQTLQAMVADKMPSGQLLLRVGGQQITATADIPVQKGARLMLEVVGLNPAPVLKIISSPNQPIAGTTPLQGQLQVLLPRQKAVTDPFKMLFQSDKSANFMSLVGVGAQELEQLRKSLRQLPDLANREALRHAIKHSGVFFEPSLMQSGGEQGQGVGSDLKAQLFKLLFGVNQSLSRMDSGQLPELLSKLKPERLPELLPELQDQALGLKKELEGALANISLKQLAVAEGSRNGLLSWSLELPFMIGEELHQASLQIQKEPNSHSADDDDQGWKIRLNTNIARLGNIDVSITLRGVRLWLIFSAEHESTMKALLDLAPQLEDALSRGGLEVSLLRSEQGMKREGYSPSVSLPQAGLDEKA